MFIFNTKFESAGPAATRLQFGTALGKLLLTEFAQNLMRYCFLILCVGSDQVDKMLPGVDDSPLG